MKEILQSLKSIYQGEKPLERHLWYLVLMILPAITSAFSAFIDKDTPKEWLPVAITCTIIFGVLSIIPGIYLIGAYFQYLKNRMNGEKGLPEIDNSLFMVGLKALPLIICWSLYFIITAVIVYGGFIAFGVASAASIGLWSIVLLPIALLMSIAIGLGLAFLALFITYINLQYCENFELKSELFNPLLIWEYISKTFKDTFIAACKYFLANIAISFAAGIVVVIIAVIIFLLGLASSLLAEAYAKFTTAGFMIMFFSIASLINMYINAIVGFGIANRLTEIYQKINTTEEEIQA